MFGMLHLHGASLSASCAGQRFFSGHEGRETHMLPRITIAPELNRLGMTEAEREKIRKFCRVHGAPHHAPTMINYVNSGGPVGARKMLDSCCMWDIADFAGVRFPDGW